MTSFPRTTVTHRSESLHLRARGAKSLPSLAAASLTAILLSACGGGDGGGSAPSADGAQGTQPGSEYRSFVSVNPQAKAAIAARPTVIKSEDGSADRETDGAADDEATSQDDAESQDSDQSASSGQSRLDTMISDMSEMNDLALKDVNPMYGFSRGPGYVILGPDSGGWNHLLPWFVHFEGEGNAARHTRIQMRNLRLFIKSRSSDEWTTVLDSDSYDGMQCNQTSNYHDCPQVANVQSEGSDGASSLPLPNLNLHGWWGARARIDHGDIAAIVVTLEARLIADQESGVDDRSEAKYLLHVGADYYPEDAPYGESLPPVGISRAKLVTNEWQSFTMSTLNDVGLQEPGGGITTSELRSNPPPLD